MLSFLGSRFQNVVIDTIPGISQRNDTKVICLIKSPNLALVSGKWATGDMLKRHSELKLSWSLDNTSKYVRRRTWRDWSSWYFVAKKSADSTGMFHFSSIIFWTWWNCCHYFLEDPSNMINMSRETNFNVV
jgi:hypothetical protein